VWAAGLQEQGLLYFHSTDNATNCTTDRYTDTDRFNIPLDTLYVILKTIIPTNHLIVVVLNKIKQQSNYNTDNLNDTYK